MDLNKLKLSVTKCHRMHIGKQCVECPELNVNKNKMEISIQEKYLCDKITCDGKQ